MKLFSPSNLIYKPAPKVDPLDFKVHVSLCIFRTIQHHVLNSYIQLLCVPKPIMSNSNAMGDALIDRARSREAADFINYTDADVIFCADDDISFSTEDAIKICQKANEKKGIVAATCVIKREEGNWIASKPLEGSEPIVFSKDAELREVKWVGAGMVAIHRNVFLDLIQAGEKIVKRFEQLADGTYVPLKNYFGEEEPASPLLPLCHKNDLRFHPFFQPYPLAMLEENDHIYLSEDWAFCQRAKDMCGYKIWLDPSTMSVTHYGTYGYNIHDLMRQPRKVYERIKYEDVPGKLIISKDDGVRLRPELVK